MSKDLSLAEEATSSLSAMSSWSREYLSALQERDDRGSALTEVIDAYSRLAERSAPPTKSDALAKTPQVVEAQTDGPHKNERLNETKAQRDEARSRLTAVQNELAIRRSATEKSEKLAAQLRTEANALRRRMKDQEAEARDKARLLDNVQNETLALNLQLNMAEEQMATVRRENEELLKRWKARVNQEVEDMNKASRF